MEAVTLTNISKRYGSVEALRGVSLSVAPGELFGIIGPDGAGKTSLFRILTTLLLADGGSASVCGLDVVKDYKAIRRRVGYMPDASPLSGLDGGGESQFLRHRLPHHHRGEL